MSVTTFQILLGLACWSFLMLIIVRCLISARQHDREREKQARKAARLLTEVKPNREHKL